MKITSLLLLCIITASCYHKSELKYENGRVVEKQYFPDTRQLVTGTGFSSKGSVIITTHQIGEDEKYMVIFQCDHGVVFSINRSDIYGSLEKGDRVQIEYFEMLNGDNEVKDLDFVNATKL